MALFPRADSAALEARLDMLPQRTQVTLTSAQIKALKASPITLVPLPGPARWIYVTEYLATFHPGTDPFTTVYNLGLYLGGPTGFHWKNLTAAGFLDQPDNQVAGALIGAGGLIGSTSDQVNQPIVLANIDAGEFIGNATNDATLTIDLSYRIQNA